MTKKQLAEKFDAFANKTVLLVGDGMIDAYMWGHVSRQSPEAPVPVVDVFQRENRLGGATNVAINLSALGAKTIFCGFVGDDDSGEVFRELLIKNNLSTEGLYVVENRPTTVKTRIIAQNKHVLRVDEETTEPLINYADFIAHIEKLMASHKIDVVLFQDYNKGVLAPEVIESVTKLANEKSIPTVVDPKKQNFFAYKNVTLFKPNFKEIKEGLEMSFDATIPTERKNAVAKLREKLNAQMVLLTLSEAGVYAQSETAETHIPAFERNIVDVSGAGDTVVSVTALALASGFDLAEIALLSNLAGGLVCEEVGVVPISKKLLLAEAEKQWGE